VPTPSIDSTALASRGIRVAEVLGCMGAIAAIKLSLAWRGFAATLARIEARSDAAGSPPPADDAIVARLDHLLAAAAALYPGRALCLERSLVLYDRLRRAGVRADLRLGVQAAPFAAHAWIERHGAPVNDVLEHIEQFTPIALGRR
jgi:hypothetical protein